MRKVKLRKVGNLGRILGCRVEEPGLPWVSCFFHYSRLLTISSRSLDSPLLGTLCPPPCPETHTASRRPQFNFYPVGCT